MPGTVTLFGSGETTYTGGRIFDALARHAPAPLHISVLETPAGFEANAERVAGRVSEFLASRLQNFQPRISQVAARKKGTPFSPDSPEVVAPLYESTMIFLGPGSPTYTVRQLNGSLAWSILQARHRLGASLVFASAATIAAGSPALPVYEIFKVGEDPHWKPGLDFFGPFGLNLAIIPHWNNQDGGAELDTSRCFIGQDRFRHLVEALPEEKILLGIDELTAVTVDFASGSCSVAGAGSIHVVRGSQEMEFPAGSSFPLGELGDYRPISRPEIGLPPDVWQQAQEAARRMEERSARSSPDEQAALEVPPELRQMVADREAARLRRDWQHADQLRRQIADLGWQVTDSPEGPRLQPLR